MPGLVLEFFESSDQKLIRACSDADPRQDMLDMQFQIPEPVAVCVNRVLTPRVSHRMLSHDGSCRCSNSA